MTTSTSWTTLFLSTPLESLTAPWVFVPLQIHEASSLPFFGWRESCVHIHWRLRYLWAPYGTYERWPHPSHSILKLQSLHGVPHLLAWSLSPSAIWHIFMEKREEFRQRWNMSVLASLFLSSKFPSLTNDSQLASNKHVDISLRSRSLSLWSFLNSSLLDRLME